ncbi:hypothetical protein BJ875DRAFT_381174 [Amylocarpus encephaloides]|uniref:RBR-type E3 ubiquitin transferase n=1 Tax=Amylocarpus encephaloides TaxID=45428 RepID=A0A9P7YEK6_9HELO|nr:hypothetical protein BJ875DRAFT_381174 [Amylocarpus encephaloides]
MERESGDDEDQIERYNCEVCWDLLPADKFPTRPPSANCEIDCRGKCCFFCLARSIYNFSQAAHWRDIKCPMCYAEMTYEDVAEFGPEHVVESYDRYTLLLALSDIPTFRFCASSNCEFGQIHPSVSTEEEIIATRVKCSGCQVVSCSKHNVPWHTNETCDQFDERILNANKGQERRSKRKVARISKRCPREGCLHRINKAGGCYHMTCICKHEFCWDCLAEYPSHKWTCPKRGHSLSFTSILDHLILDPIVWPLQRRYERRQERRREIRENRILVDIEA